MQEWEVEQMVDEAAEQAGWNENSKMAVLYRIIGEVARTGKALNESSLSKMLEDHVKEEAEIASGFDDVDSDGEEFDSDFYTGDFDEILTDDDDFEPPVFR